MPAPALPKTLALVTLRDRLVYTLAALKNHPLGQPLAPRVQDLLARWQPVFLSQLELWDAQTLTQFGIHRADDTLDDLIDEFVFALLTLTKNNRAQEPYLTYIELAPAKLTRPVLGEELETARGWLDLLTEEEHASLRDFRPRLEAAVEAADAAVGAKGEADARNEMFRARGELAKYVESVARTLDEVWTSLDQARNAHPELALHRTFASRFFPPAVETLSDEERAARAAAKDAQKREAADKRAKLKEARARVKAAQAELEGLKKS